MAANFIELNKTSDVGRILTRGLQMVREGREALRQARAILIQMRDGDGSDAAHYDLVASKAGYVANDLGSANAAAKASFDELDSLFSKLATDNATSNVAAAIDQACAKHGV